MPKVFTGKVVIPSDQFDDYLQALEAGQKARAPFRQYMNALNPHLSLWVRKKLTKT
jgi:hypothetical protein